MKIDYIRLSISILSKIYFKKEQFPDIFINLIALIKFLLSTMNKVKYIKMFLMQQIRMETDRCKISKKSNQVMVLV